MKMEENNMATKQIRIDAKSAQNTAPATTSTKSHADTTCQARPFRISALTWLMRESRLLQHFSGRLPLKVFNVKVEELLRRDSK